MPFAAGLVVLGVAGSVFLSCFETEYVVPSLGPKAPRADLRASSEDCPCASCEPRLGLCRKAMSTASGIVTSPAGTELPFPDERLLPLKTGTAALPAVLIDGVDDAAKASPQPKGPASAPTTRKNRLSSGMRFIYLLRKIPQSFKNYSHSAFIHRSMRHWQHIPTDDILSQFALFVIQQKNIAGKICGTKNAYAFICCGIEGNHMQLCRPDKAH